MYTAVMNAIQVPAGAGEGCSYDFDIVSFAQAFKVDALTATYAIKILEQEGVLLFSDTFFKPATVVFNCDQQTLRDFELVHPELDDIVKGLLRSYEGIVDFPTSINETLLAKFVNKTKEYVMQQLTRLQQLGIIEYVKQKESPQITLLLNRMYIDSFVINLDDYLQRKQQFEERIQAIIQYVLQTTDCRSKVIAAYFNDSEVKRCGICDNCIHLKLMPVSMLDFENIESHLYSLIVDRKVTINNLLSQSKDIQRDKLWIVFNYLQAEKKVIVNKDGYLERI